jgi:hypothetical protein
VLHLQLYREQVSTSFFRDRAVREAAREISRLPKQERRLVLGIVRQFGNQQPSG